jgi:formate dehydrogenase iron-sulfur subunit
MVYRDTPRALWASRITSAKFLLSGALTGLSALLAFIAVYARCSGAAAGFGSGFAAGADAHALATALYATLPLLLIAKLACEAQVHRHLDDQDANPLKKAALLLRGQLRGFHTLRFNLGLLSGFLLPLFQLYRGYSGSIGDAVLAGSIAVLLLAGELCERYLFFTACVPPRMPGA